MMSSGAKLRSQLKVRHGYDAGLLPLPVINSNWMRSNAKLCVTKACSVGGRVKAGLWNINNSERWPKLWYLQTHEAQGTAWVCAHSYRLQGLILLQMEHVYCPRLPKAIRFISFYYRENAPGLVLKWHEEAHLTAMVKGKSTVGAELLCGPLLTPLEQEKNTSVSPFGGPGWLESDKDLLLQKLFSGIWFLPLDSPCMVMDVFFLNIFWYCDYLCGFWVTYCERVRR